MTLNLFKTKNLCILFSTCISAFIYMSASIFFVSYLNLKKLRQRGKINICCPLGEFSYTLWRYTLLLIMLSHTYEPLNFIIFCFHPVVNYLQSSPQRHGIKKNEQRHHDTDGNKKVAYTLMRYIEIY